jgi:histidinol-phosphate aminotransferase
MIEIFDLVRKNILEMESLTSPVLKELEGVKARLDANENAMGSPLNKWYHRYPDPYHHDLRNKISKIKNIPAENIMLGNGSDECVDLLMRVFCEPAKDNIIICSPTTDRYGRYAALNNVLVKEVPLNPDFQLDLEGLESAVDEYSKMIFICSPNDPTGNTMDHEDIETIIMNFPGIVVVDEAYINFSRNRSFIPEIKNYSNLVVLQSFSKAWGLAGLRVGMALGSAPLINLLNRVRPPHNVNTISQELVVKALDNLQDVNTMIMETVNQRKQLEQELMNLPLIKRVFHSEANFLLVEFNEATGVLHHLGVNGILVSDKIKIKGCENCLRITVGTEKENSLLIQTLKAFG